MKQLVLLAGHFAPSNLAAVHRSRLWAQHLPEFGWEPTILTTHHRHYEEALDWELASLVSPELRVIRTPALPTRPLRVVGDIGVRALPFHYRALRQLARRGELDFLHITIPSHYSALLGRMVHARTGLPYGLDYIDPWVHQWPGSDRPFSKAWASERLAHVLEPWAVRDAALITGVAPLYFEDMLDRNPQLRARAVSAAMPYGGSEADFAAVRARPPRPYLFDPDDGRFHMLYAGAMLPKAYPVLERLLAGLVRLREQHPELADRLRIHFVGTGSSPDDPAGHNILPHARRLSVGDMVDEHPARIPYADVLAHLARSSANLLLGSTERHYTPSKVFQSVQARRPLLALLHRESSAAAILAESRAGLLVTFDEQQLPTAADIAAALVRLLQGSDGYAADSVVWPALDAYSARASARALSAALDEALARASERASR